MRLAIKENTAERTVIALQRELDTAAAELNPITVSAGRENNIFLRGILRSLLVVGCFFLSFSASAQVLTTNLDKKVLMADSLHLPSNTSVLNAMSILPEVLQRPGTSLLSNYDIQVDGMSLGNMSDDALSQLQLIDIEKIEVSESPISTYQNNGQGGSINLILRSSGHHGENLWGSVGMAGFAPLDIQPQFTMGYRTQKFMVRGLALGNIYNYASDTKTDTYEGDQLTSSTSTEKYRLRGQLARAYLQFTPNERNTLKWNVSHEYSYTNDKLSVADVQTSEQTEKASTLRTLFNYKYDYRRFTLETELQYVYSPSSNNFDKPSDNWFNHDYKTHNVSGKVEMKGSLLADGLPSTLFLTVGCNGNGVFKNENTQSQMLTYRSPVVTLEPDNRTHYFMPYLKLESTIGKFRLMALGEWQNYRYHIDYNGNPYTKVSNDFTGKLIGEWHYNAHQNLRLVLDRKLSRPSENQLYPYIYYNPALSGFNYVKGDAYLVPMLSHEVMLDYLSDYRWGEHSLQIGASVGYNHVDDIIQSYVMGGSAVSGGMLGSTLQYTSYHNVDNSNIIFASLLADYAYRFFNVSLTGEIYNNSLTHDGTSDHHTYYNLSLRPSLQFNNGWTGSLRLTYYSKVDRRESTLGSHTLAVMSIGKRWNFTQRHSLYAYIYGRVSLTGKAKDKSYGTDSYTVTTYDLSRNTVGAGVKYNF